MKNKNAIGQDVHRQKMKHGGLFKKVELYLTDKDAVDFKKQAAELRKKRLEEFEQNNLV